MMDFFTNTNNLLLIATLVTSGLALALPNILGRMNRQILSVHESVKLVNERSAQIVDVRTVDEFKAGHVAKSKNLPAKEFDSDLKNLKLDASKPVILVCLSGSRANNLLGKFKKAGFAEVACMDGGIAAWKDAGLPLVK